MQTKFIQNFKSTIYKTNLSMNIFLDDCVKTIQYTATLLNKKKRQYSTQ